MNWLLVGILAVNAITLMIVVAFFIKAARLYQDIQYLFTPKGDGLPSPAYEMVTALAEAGAQALFRQVKTSFGGLKSGEVRAGKAIDADMAEAVLEATNPALATMINAIPGLKKTLRRNPGLIDLAMEKLGGRFGPQAAAPIPANNANNQLALDEV